MRYGHVTRPTAIALVCPRCGGHALATQPAYASGILAAGDCSQQWGEPWTVACQRCPYRIEGLDWDHMLGLSKLYFSAIVGGVELWAWNREHLRMIRTVLEGRPLLGDPFAYLATYLRGEWLRRSRRERFARAARAMLARGG
jgi:hypothetical protein